MRRSRLLIPLLLFLLPYSAAAEGRLWTYLEGTLVRQTGNEWVLATNEGTYWIAMYRNASFKRKHRAGRVSFWVQVEQIRRFRVTPAPVEPIRYTHKETKIARK